MIHGFLGPTRRTFAHYHVPTAPARPIGYVVCPPVGYEAVHCHNTLRHLAGELAAAGFPVLRIDYDGTGESLGSDADPGRLAAWIESVKHGVQALSEMGVEGTGLVGIRMGATLAAVVAAEIGVHHLVLWEPCITGASFAREIEILASAGLGAAGGPGSQAGSTEPRADGLQAAGYLYTPETIQDLKGIDLRGITPRGGPPVLVVSRDDRPAPTGLVDHLRAAGCSATAEQLPGHAEMMGGGYAGASQVPHGIVARIVEWARQHVGANEKVAQPGTPDLALEVVSGGLRRGVVKFGPADRLFGVVTHRELPAGKELPSVVMLSAAGVPRTGANRMYVTLADRLAAQGHAVLRFDISGIGESPPAEGEAPNQPYARSLLPDVRLALDFMAAEHGVPAFWVVGLCSGAAAAYQTTLGDARVAGMVLINPPVFYWEAGVASDSLAVQQFSASRYYRQALFRPSAWLRLLSGKAAVGHIARLVATRAGTWIRARRAALATALGLGTPAGLAADLLRARDRGTSVRLAFSPGDQSLDGFTHAVGKSRKRLEGRGVVVRVFDGADSTFGPLKVRGELLDWILAAVSGRG